MRKIYLAISEKEKQEIQDLIQSIEPNIPIIPLQSKSEVTAALANPFVLCVTSSDLIDLKVLEQSELSGKVMVLDSTNQLKSTNDNIVMCLSTNDLVFKIRMIKFNELKYDKKGTLPPSQNAENPEHPQTFKSESREENDAGSQEKTLDGPPKELSAEMKKVREKNSKDENIIPEESVSLPNQVPQVQVEIEEKKITDTAKTTGKREEKKTPPKVVEDNKNMSKKHSFTEKALGIGEAMDLVTFKNKKTVGLWAPLSAGVTTFLVDFAIYLQQYDAPVAVVEVPKKNQHHLKILERFGSKPDNWVSLIENFHTTTEPNNKSLWMYRGVRWFPLGLKDLTYKRDREFTNNFFLAVKRTNFVLVDLPTGEMDAATLDSLPHLDELWIFVDDDFDRQLDWKEFIFTTLIESYQLNVKLIHSRTSALKSRPKDVAEKFSLPLIAVLPAMWELVLANKHQNKPLIDNLVGFKKMEHSFYQLAKELIGEDLEKNYKPTFWLKMKRKLFTSIASS